jgi:hypothetical protein
MQRLRPEGWGRALVSLVQAGSIFLTLLVSLGGCLSKVESTGVGQEPITIAPPAGCERTMCDYLFEGCEDPCKQCWVSCGHEVDRSDVIQCAHTCNAVCVLGGDAGAARAGCAEERDKCRTTSRNAICVDHLSDVMPDTERPCTREMSSANCACGSDIECAEALEKMSPHCSKCNSTWRVRCIDAACRAQDQALFACLDAHHCSTVGQCGALCAAPYEDLGTCLKDAEIDERDIGGCFSGPRTCWDEPFCPHQD